MLINGQGSHIIFIEKGVLRNPIIQLKPHFIEIINEDEQQKFCDEYFLHFNFIFTQEEHRRILQAIEWYNRSLIINPEIDRSEAVINMTIAFESLFKIREGEHSVKEHLKNNICNLLGDITGLSHWIDEFWDIRNQIVHGDRKSITFLYKAQNSKQPHQNHLYMARFIFNECIKAFVIIRTNLRTFILQEELISNEQRMNEARLLLAKANNDLSKAVKNKALRIIAEIRKNDIAPSIKDSIKFGKIFLNFILHNLDITDLTQRNLAEIIREIIAYEHRNYENLVILYRRADSIKPWHFINREDYSDDNMLKIELGRALEGFMDYMDNRWFHYELQRQG
jgi:hypothetical protein